MKKIFYIIVGFLLSINFFIVEADLKTDMLPNSQTVGVSGDGMSPLNKIITYIKDFLFDILWIIVVGVFLYFGYKLISARGNQEDFKKALMGFIYAIVGLAIIPLAWGAVKLISSLNF